MGQSTTDDRERAAAIEAFLAQEPGLAEMRERYPTEWAEVQRDIKAVLATGERERLEAYVQALASPPEVLEAKGRVKRRNALADASLRQAMAAEVIRQRSVAAATGVDSGRVRFRLLDGWLLQRLLFERDLVRKPVSMRRFRRLWPLIRQRRYLMPLVQPKGIYCFYSRELIAALAQRIGDRSCLEIAAGDGTLARFLADAGVDIVATDDHSWDAVTFPEDVVDQDAKTALERRPAEVVICSWPPAGNDFERFVFRTPSVRTYIVIASRSEAGAGAWNVYRRQQAFEFEEVPELSRLVLPPELESAVYVFERR